MNYKLLLMSCLCAAYSTALASSDDSSDVDTTMPYVKYARSEYKNRFNRSLDLDLFFSSGNDYEENQIQERVTHCAANLYHVVEGTQARARTTFAPVSSDSDDDFYKNPIIISSDDDSTPRQKSVEEHQAKFSRAVERAQSAAQEKKKKPLQATQPKNDISEQKKHSKMAHAEPELSQEKQPRNNGCLRICALWCKYKAE